MPYSNQSLCVSYSAKSLSSRYVTALIWPADCSMLALWLWEGMETLAIIIRKPKCWSNIKFLVWFDISRLASGGEPVIGYDESIQRSALLAQVRDLRVEFGRYKRINC